MNGSWRIISQFDIVYFSIYQQLIPMDLKIKQDYLFKEIIEANYDPQEFQDYIENYKGLSLDLYSLQQLTKIVQDFKNPQPKQEISQASSDQQSNKPSIQKQQQVEKEVQILNPDTQSHSKEDVELKEGKDIKKGSSCNTSTKTHHQFITKTIVSPLYKKVFENHQNICVKIRSYSKNEEESLFKNPYVAYHIETPSSNWAVKRRFKDFQWLHTKLSLMYPGLPIPPIPKKTTMRFFDDKHLEERMITFEKFVNKLIRIPEVCSDQILIEFLSISSSTEFKNCKERYEIKINNKGDKVLSLKGQNVINMSVFTIEPKDMEFHNISLQIIQNLNINISTFQKALKIVTEKAFELSSAFSEAYVHLARKEIVGNQILDLMGQFVSELGYRLDKEYFFIKSNIQNYWAYEEKYLQNLIMSLDKLKREETEMVNKYKNISTHSQDLESEQSYQGNKIFSQYLSTKEMYRIKLSFLSEEISRHKKQDLVLLSKQWLESMQQYMGGVKELMLSGADQLTKALCISQGKKLVQVEYLSERNSIRESVINQK